MSRLLIVAAGGALGSVGRYLLSGVVQQHTTPYFPMGTAAVNVAGCFMVGLAAGLANASVVGPNTRLFLIVGLCGGFTTFSAFAFETLGLVRDNELWRAGLNAGGQLFVGLVAVWAGLALARLIWGA